MFYPSLQLLSKISRPPTTSPFFSFLFVSFLFFFFFFSFLFFSFLFFSFLKFFFACVVRGWGHPQNLLFSLQFFQISFQNNFFYSYPKSSFLFFLPSSPHHTTPHHTNNTHKMSLPFFIWIPDTFHFYHQNCCDSSPSFQGRFFCPFFLYVFLIYFYLYEFFIDFFFLR